MFAFEGSGRMSDMFSFSIKEKGSRRRVVLLLALGQTIRRFTTFVFNLTLTHKPSSMVVTCEEEAENPKVR